jgi:D-inositol-3-phosphate glycosyltransferase
MNILFENINGDPFRNCAGEDTSGQNLFVREVGWQMARRGHRVDIATRATEPGDRLVEIVDENLRILRVPAGPCEYLFRDRVADLVGIYTQGLLDLLREQRGQYDIAHSNYWLSIPVGQAVRAAGLSGRLIFTPHSLGRNKARCTGIRIAWRDQLESEIIRSADGVHVLSNEDETRLRELYGEGRRVRAIRHGIDPARFRYLPQAAARARMGWRANAPILLFVGRMEPQKNLPAALRVFEGLTALFPGEPGLELVIAGGVSTATPAEKDLPPEVWTAWQGLLARDRVRFLGRLPHDQLPWVYAGADALLMPSLYEPFGLVCAESIAVGTPVAAYATGGLRETITPGVNGMLVPVGDEEGLTEAVRGLLQPAWCNHRTRATRIAPGGPRTWEHVAQDLEKLYLEVSSPP